MKRNTPKTIIAALAVTLAAFAHPALAENRLKAAMPEIQSVEQLRADTLKRLADIRTREAQAKASGGSKIVNLQSSITNDTGHFYTGKPYLGESGQYVFLFRNYDPELGRWTSADPSGFPDGANNIVFVGNAASYAFDPNGLAKSVLWLYAWKGNGTDNNSYTQFQAEHQAKYQELVGLDSSGPDHYLDDGDSFDFNSIDNINQLSSFSSYDQIYIALHGWSSSMPQNIQGTYRIGGTEGYGSRYTEQQIKDAAPNITKIMGCTGNSISASDISAAFFDPTKTFLKE